MNQGIYGKYNVEVLKQDGESYYPFGSGYQNNIILDEFFGKVLSGWKHSPQAWMQTCITNTGNNAPSRFDTTGTFKYGDGPAFNDRTWASTVFLASVNTGEKTISMTRDFIFDTITGDAKTYREAMVGLFYKNDSNVSANIESDIALSHFVFSSDITLVSGERLKINYNLNLVVNYLSPTGEPFQLTGGGYNFNGRIKLMSDVGGVIGRLDGTSTYFSYDTSSATFGRVSNITKNITSNANTYTFDSSSSNTFASPFLGGFKTIFNNVGFYGSGANWPLLLTYPNQFNGSTQSAITGNAAQLSMNNFQASSDGAYADINYYFPPSTLNRDVSGILLTNYGGSSNASQNYDGITYLQFDSGLRISANDPISMRVRWSFSRL